MNRDERKNVQWWKLLLILFTIAATITKLYIGMDHDESYVTVLGIRLLNGDRMFDTMWDLHMTSALPAWFFTWIFTAVTGGIEGLVVFLRLVSVLFQVSTAVVFYQIMKKYYPKNSVFLTAVLIANVLPRATQNLEYGLLEMLFMILAVTLLYDAVQIRSKMGKSIAWKPVVWRSIVAGICYAAAVLSYPTVILSFPVLLVVLWGGQEKGTGRMRIPLLFTAVCAGLAVLFLGYVCSYLSLPDLLANLHGILSDGSHAEVSKAASYGKQAVEAVKRAVIFMAAAGVFYAAGRKWIKDITMFSYYLLAAMALVMIGFNVTGIRPSGPLGLQVRYLVVTVLAVVFYYQMPRRDKLLAGLFWLTGVAVYVGTMYGSNMGIEENASFLYLPLIMAVLLGSALLESGEVSGIVKTAGAEQLETCGDRETIGRRVGNVCVLLFVVSIIFTKGYLVRITGTGPANVMESRVRMTEGMLSGIYLYPEHAEKLAEQECEIRRYSDETDTILYLGDDAVCNTFTEGAFTSATCISTPVYNEEWVLYYENEQHPKPTVVFVDKAFVGNWDKFAETEFGIWLQEKYPIKEDDVIEEKAFYILKL